MANLSKDFNLTQMQILKTTWNYQVGLIEFDMYDRYGTPMRM